MQQDLLSGIEIRKLDASTKEDFLRYFDKDALGDNPYWNGCYCQFYLREDADGEWIQRDPANRANAARRIEAGTMKGLLAFDEGKVVGWCHVNFKKDIAAYREGAGPAEAVILCFVIAPWMRRKGLASRLLDEAIAFMAESGAASIEAYPIKAPRAPELSYHGYLGMYLDRGFVIAGEDEHTYTVRRVLD